jgi:isoleucyl-tRNA synthetase
VSEDATVTQYRPLDPASTPASLEEEMVRRWEEEGLFRQILAAREGAPEWVFFEGPPTANGRPGIHHVFARTIKDLFCRHRVMRGYHVTRKAGWDTHGLPVEIEVEKQLGISGKQDIERIGVAEFNRLCRESVFTYRADWEKLSARIGYDLDYSDPYVTYTNDYVESVWWALATLHRKDLLYRGHKILPYCARCGTALSSHEVAQGYEDVKDPSVYVALDLADEREPGAGTREHESAPALRRRILVWTTTPWTLVSNTALAVNPELDYVEVRKRTGVDWTLILAASRALAVLGDGWQDRWEVLQHMSGRELEGKRYRRPLDWVEFPADGKREVIVAESFVSAEDGSGVVHMSPAFGADDYAAGQRHGLAFVQPVDLKGEFPKDMPLVGGQFVKKADKAIIAELERRDVLWKATEFEHAYPHCWRCGTPLLYYARTSWFVRTSSYKDRMLARNAQVNWNPPEVGEGRFGQWLENNIDWAISRDRYWGTPLPVWVNDEDADEFEVLESFAQLAERIGRPLPADFDPHKPHVDQYTWPARSGKGTMRRVPEVIDTWFDSGSMPFAQWHYPFENKDVVAHHYPGDFIAEGVDQTRGWFYSLLAIATGLGDALPNNDDVTARGSATAAPYKAVVVNDLVLDKDGRKMSKSRKNTVDPWGVMERHGADATRLFLLTSGQVWLPRRFDEAAIRKTTGAFLSVTLRNVYSGIFAQYANFGWSPSEADPPVAERPSIDRWILSRLTQVEDEANAYLERFDATQAARLVMEFVEEDVSRWHVRRSRARFYEVDGPDNRAAFATLHEVLVVACRLLAPFCPFVTDWLHRELTGRSVHLAPYVREGSRHRDEALERAMAQVRELVTLGLSARTQARIRVKQPLARMVCVVPQAQVDALVPLVPLLQDELNVKQVEFAGSADALVHLEAKANFRTLGKKFGKATPLAAAAVAALASDALRAFEHGEPLSVTVEGTTRHLDADDLTILRRATGDLVVAEAAGYFAAIDPAITPALRREGIAREVVSLVQGMRKDSGFHVSDRIRMWLSGAEEVEAAAREHRAWIAGEVLARDVAIGDGAGSSNDASNDAAREFDLDGSIVRIALTREA